MNQIVAQVPEKATMAVVAEPAAASSSLVSVPVGITFDTLSRPRPVTTVRIVQP
jgi:hypothetical protein